ncbi:MAG: hypothetical protein KAX65_08115, partial [Caldilineaceae bacterium]|nr:hypothetical protein [Caldilineaceae bacterium]
PAAYNQNVHTSPRFHRILCTKKPASSPGGSMLCSCSLGCVSITALLSADFAVRQNSILH